MGDYDQAVATNNGFYVSWSDSRSDLPGGAPRKDPNVYFALVPPTGLTPAAVLNFTSASLSGGNGNGTIDLGETVNITVSLTNTGAASATNITSVLSTNTPGVNITQANSAYADIAVAGSGDNVTAFTVTTTSDFTCGPVEFTLTVNYAGGSRIINFTLPASGVVGNPVTFSNNTPTAIVDQNTINIPINVSDFTSAISKATLSLYLTHTFDADLRISLISPDGTTVVLSNARGGSGDNYGSSCSTRTVFDDDASTLIGSGTAPFVGTFKPEQPLSAFSGKSKAAVNGTWTLRITDNALQDVGTFQCATLTLSPITCPASEADLQITKAAAATINANTDLTYTITITNNGP